MSSSGKTSSIRYADKSADQPELIPVFNDLKKAVSKYVQGHYVVKDDLPGNYSVYYSQPVETAGRNYPEVPFAALLIQKGYVGFYLFCLYTDPSLKNELSDKLRKVLKGKTCIHIRNTDDILLKDVDDALQAGLRLYHNKGWK